MVKKQSRVLKSINNQIKKHKDNPKMLKDLEVKLLKLKSNKL